MRGAGANTICLKTIMRRSITKENMTTLTSSKNVKYRYGRLQEIKPNAIVRELAYFSSTINNTRKE